MKRLVETNRWKDGWFVELTPNAKLLLSYLYDCCDEIGSIDLNYSIWSAQLKMEKQLIVESLKELQPALLSDKKKKLFIKDFLKHQKKLPLINGNEEHDWIITKLKNSLEKFNNAPEILKILDNHVINQNETKQKKERVNRKKTFIEPTFEELKEYYLSEKPDAEMSAIQDIYDHYKSVNWVTKGGTDIKDWQSAVRKAIRNREDYSKGNRNYNNNSADKKTTRTETTLSVVDELKKNS